MAAKGGSDRSYLDKALEQLQATRERSRQLRATAGPKGVAALQLISKTVRQNPTTGQSTKLIAFLACLYNGQRFPFDLSNLRALEIQLADACLDLLNYDRTGRDGAPYSWRAG